MLKTQMMDTKDD